MLEAIKIYFLPFLVSISVALYLQSKILNKKINFKNVKNYLLFVVCIILGIASMELINYFFRFMFLTILLGVVSCFIFEEHLYKTFVASFLQQTLLFISEIILVIICSIMSVKIFFLTSVNLYIFTISNIIISVFAILLYRTKFVNILFNKIICIFDSIGFFAEFGIIYILLITSNVLLTTIYFYDSNVFVMILNVSFIIIYSIIIYFYVYEKNKNIVYLKENKILISNLNEYEKMLDYQRVNNHENKNQLLVIKSMIEKNKDNVIEYIDEIIKEKREDNEIIYNKAKRIPSGGLQGLIYQKMLLMQEKNIEVNLDINSQVRKIDFGNLSSKMNYDICRIAGIIIDNAIEETLKFNKKEREIIISMYVDDMFIIEVSNRIKDDVDLSKIYEKGYTSKEKGHGYGLSLLKKIVDENEKIENEVKIINNIFTQIIKIKM